MGGDIDVYNRSLWWWTVNVSVLFAMQTAVYLFIYLCTNLYSFRFSEVEIRGGTIVSKQFDEIRHPLNLTAKIITFSCTGWLPREHSQFWGLSLYSWSAVLEVWIQLVHYIKTITFVLLWSASVLSNWRLAVGPVLLPPTLNVLWCTFKSLYLRRVSIFIHSLVMIHPYNLI